MNNLLIYTHKRINFGLWMGVSTVLICLSLNTLHITSFHIYSFPFLLFALLNLRLFDDLSNRKHDDNKPSGKLFNESNITRYYLIVFAGQIVLTTTLLIFDAERAKLLALFFGINYLIYSLLINKSKLRPYIPLIKYPCLVYIISMEFTPYLLLIYLIFVAFEMLEDKTFPGYVLKNYKGSLIIKYYIPYIFIIAFTLLHLLLIPR